MWLSTPFALLATLLPAIELASAGATYNMVQEYAGSTFFQGWDFYDNFDNLTNGNANFVSASDGLSKKLAYIDPSTNHAIMRIDNTSTVALGGNRNSVRISTKNQYTVGSVWITDMYHVPFGCSVWPAWWSEAPNWPAEGEIDTFEGVNAVTMNQMGLHTAGGCSQVSPNQTSTLINATNCDVNASGNQGCVVTNPTTASYGAGFAAAGGGVFVTEFAESGISIWFFERQNVPTAISSNSSTIDTTTLGTPVGNWPTGGCPIDQFFGAQHLIFDITLCGDFAGTASIFAQTCSGICYDDYVVGSGSNYADAYFEVSFVRVFGTSGDDTVIFNGNSGALTLSTRGWALATTLGIGVLAAVAGWL